MKIFVPNLRYQNLLKIAPHYKIMIKFTFWKIDLCDNDEFYIKIDDKEVQKIAFQKTDGIELCGVKQNNPGHGEKIVAIKIIQKHQEPSLKMTFSSSLTMETNQQSWGVRDFFLFAAQCTKFCDECVGNAENECTKYHSNHTLQNEKYLNKNQWYFASKEFFDMESFQKIEQWNFQELDHSSPNPPITKCSDIDLIGGYESFGKKTKASKKFILPKHDYVRVRATIYKIDNWEGEEFTMSIDNSEVWIQFLGWNDPALSDIFGNKSIIKFDKIVTHSNAELQLDLVSTLKKKPMKYLGDFETFSFYILHQMIVFNYSVNTILRNFRKYL
ncbi:unnamed protein product (macronuclear) [Paramecium tetraurelia]|uniref:Uncharacterized protein n=1 Tax=Paramecium tetraurelia TaxID=5888 RepID=A0CE45_PARTE|nr:uncharacterized protein GSPATT00037498001 [Paramecium tetraurelia]CAK69062.1 unnamed protein product [Paramecium tetraurelia]|eukprot:XP_001436459.1 hypothetical protein (macronuclear) [Paramecium tetraurelia strain d4-2]